MLETGLGEGLTRLPEVGEVLAAPRRFYNRTKFIRLVNCFYYLAYLTIPPKKRFFVEKKLIQIIFTLWSCHIIFLFLFLLALSFALKVLTKHYNTRDLYKACDTHGELILF